MTPRSVLLHVRVAAAVVLALGLRPAAAQVWEPAPAMSTARADAASAVYNGRLYVFGGRLAGGMQLRSAEVFDPATGWSPLPPMDHPRVDARAAVLDGAIYVTGGREGPDASDDVEVFRPDLNRWVSAAHLDEPRVGHAMGVVGSDLFVIGGGGGGPGGGLLRSAERYRGGRWETYTPWTLGQPRALSGSASLAGGIVLAGGFGQAGPVALVSRYVPDLPPSPLPPMQHARGALALATDGASLFAVGGRDAANARVASVERLAAGAAAWDALASLPEGREGLVAAVLGTDLYVAGGTTDFGTVLSTVLRLPMVAVAGESGPAADAPLLALAGPNPTRGAVRLRFTLARAGEVRLTLLDVRGRLVATLADAATAPGPHDVTWDASALPAGVYAARLVTPDGTATVRFALVR